MKNLQRIVVGWHKFIPCLLHTIIEPRHINPILFVLGVGVVRGIKRIGLWSEAEEDRACTIG
jgi:hypothetical protein